MKIDRNEVNATAVAYRQNPTPELGHKLWELVVRYFASLQGKPSLVGYSVEDAMADAYMKMLDSARDYRPEKGVDFLLYFRMRLHGSLAYRRRCENLALGREAPLNDTIPEDGIGRPEKRVLRDWKQQIEEMEVDEETKALTAAFIELHAAGIPVRGGKLSGKTGLSMRQVSRALPKVPMVVKRLILDTN
jgi:DNA-directed RNA polymerase specialized sigma24 family protein